MFPGIGISFAIHNKEVKQLKVQLTESAACNLTVDTLPGKQRYMISDKHCIVSYVVELIFTKYT